MNAVNYSEYKALREKILNKEISVSELDTAVIDAMVSYEIDRLSAEKGSVEFVMLCARELNSRKVLLSDRTRLPGYARHDKEVTVTAIVRRLLSYFRKKRSLLVRATAGFAVVILSMVFTVISPSAYQMSVDEAILYVASQPPGTIIEVGNHTFYRPGDERFYNTIEEMVEKENLDIMYPHAYPDNFDIREICISSDYRAELCATISTYNPHVVIAFSIGVDSPPVSIVNRETYTVGDSTFVLLEQEVEGIYNAICLKNGNEYYISVEGYDNLLYVLDNFKE